jgi:hypothetical protein
MTWRAIGLANIASHVIESHLIRDTRVQNALDARAVFAGPYLRPAVIRAFPAHLPALLTAFRAANADRLPAVPAPREPREHPVVQEIIGIVRRHEVALIQGQMNGAHNVIECQ